VIEDIPEDQLVKEPKVPDQVEKPPVYPDAPIESYFEDMSSGRVYLNLTKSEQPSRWKRLYDNKMQARVGNI
jgi:hypothetical protein